jgi:hypothetical protein
MFPGGGYKKKTMGGQMFPVGGARKNKRGMRGGQCGTAAPVMRGGQCTSNAAPFMQGGAGFMPEMSKGGSTLLIGGGRKTRRKMRGGYNPFYSVPSNISGGMPDTNNTFEANKYSSNVVPTVNMDKMMMGGDGYAYGGQAIGGLGSVSRYTEGGEFKDRGGNNNMKGGKRRSRRRGSSKKWSMKGCSGGAKRTKKSKSKRKARRSHKRMRGGCSPKALGFSDINENMIVMSKP